MIVPIITILHHVTMFFSMNKDCDFDNWSEGHYVINVLQIRLFCVINLLNTVNTKRTLL